MRPVFIKTVLLLIIFLLGGITFVNLAAISFVPDLTSKNGTELSLAVVLSFTAIALGWIIVNFDQD